MIQQKQDNNRLCYNILNELSKSTKIFMETLKKEEEYLNLIQRYWSGNMNKKENGNDTVILREKDEKSLKREDLLKNIENLLSNFKDFLENIDYKLDLITEENKNNSYFIREEINTYADITVKLANFSDKLTEYQISMKMIETDRNYLRRKDSEEVCSLNKFMDLSNAISFSIKNGDSSGFKLNDILKAGLIFKKSNSDNLNGNVEEDRRKIESKGSKESTLNILKNENYFHGLKENNYEDFMCCLKKFAKLHEINLKFLKDIRRVIDQEYDVDYTMSRRQWFKRIAVNNNVLQVYEFVNITLVTSLNEFPHENLDSFLNSFFKNYFYKLENNTIKIFGKLLTNHQLKNYIKMNKFPEQFNIVSCKMKVYYWFQDLVDIFNLHTSEYITNVDEQSMKILIDSTQELIMLRDIYAKMIVDHYRKKHPQATIEELQY